MMRRSAITLGLVALAGASGCRDEAPSVERPASPDTSLGVSAARALDADELAPAGDADAAPGDPQAPVPAGEPCPGGPVWTAVTRCAEGGYLYALGKTSGVTSPDLARTTAANRARALLAAADPLELTQPRTLERVEILEHARCGETMHALARMPLPEGASVTPCAADSTTLSAGEGDTKRCPAWTNRGVWVEGSDLIAVASARAGNPMLAEKMARNRAAAEVARYANVTVANKGGAVEVSSSSRGGLVPGESERAECDGFVYVKVRHGLTAP